MKTFFLNAGVALLFLFIPKIHNAQSTIIADGPTTFCQGDSVILSGNVMGVWSNLSLASSIVVKTSGTYFVTNLDILGGTLISNQIVVTVNPLPIAATIVANAAVELCLGASVTLSGNVNGVWNTGEVGTSITVSAPGTYFVVNTNLCGSDTSNHIIVTAAAGISLIPPVITATGSIALCAGASVTLLSNNITGGVWSTGEVTASIIVSTPGDYFVTLTDSCGSVTSNHIIVTAGSSLVPPVITAAGSIALCAGASVTLLGNIIPGGVWSTGEVTASIIVSVAGDYFVTLTDSCGTVTSNHIIVTEGSSLVPPVITAAGSIALCAGASVTLLGNIIPGGVWSTGEVTASIIVSVAGDYFVTLTDSCGTVTSNHIIVTEGSSLVPPVITAAGSIALCAGASVMLLGNIIPGGVWSTGEVTASIVVSVAGDYFVTLTDSCGTVTSNHIIVTEGSSLVPPVITAAGSIALCAGASVTLLGNIIPGGVWSTGEVTASIVVSVAGDYFVTLTDSCGTVTSNHIIVTEGSSLVPPVITAAGSIALCAGASVTLLGNIIPGGVWSTGEVTASIVVSVAGDYFVTLTDSCGTVTSNHIIVTEGSSLVPPVITAAGSITLCAGASVTLLGNIIPGGVWSTGEVTASIVVSVAGDYFVALTDSCGTVASNHIIVTEGTSLVPPVITASGSIALCAGASVTLLGNIAGGVWSTGEVTASIVVSVAGDYFVTLNDSCGTVTSNHIIVTEGTSLVPPVITASGSIALCARASVTLLGNIPNVGVWSTGAVTASIVVSTPGDYFITVTDSCGIDTSNHIIVTARAGVALTPPVITATGSVALCAGASVTLLGNIPNVGVWSTGAVTASIIVSTPGDYFVTLTDSCGSVTSNHIIVTVSASPPVGAITANGSTILCPGGGIILSGNSGGTWSNGSPNSSIFVTVPGDYFVTYALPCGNVNSNHIQVSFHTPAAAPTISASGSLALCVGGTITLNGNNGGIWNTGATTPSITVNTSGDYFVIYPDICTNVTSNHLIVTGSLGLAGPITANGSTTLCAGNGVILSGNNGGTWSNGATTPSITVITSGDYYVIYKNACDSVFSNHINVNITPSDNCAITSNGSFFQNDSIRLCAALGFSSYAWSTGASTSCITVRQPGTYSVTITDSGGCKSSCTKTITADQGLVVEIIGNTNIQQGQDWTTLCAAVSCNATYLWSNGATSRCITVSDSGTYSVTVTGPDGFTGVGMVMVKVSSAPYCLITGDDYICEGSTTNLCAPTGSGYTYQWSSGETSSCITIGCGGSYKVTITHDGVSTTCSKKVYETSIPPFTIVGNSSLCQGTTTTFCAPVNANSSYLWSTGATTRCITITSAGNYSVTQSKFGCSVTSPVKSIVINPLPGCTITGNLNPDQGETTTLCAPAGMNAYKWSNGATTSCITVNSTGIYSVKVTNNSGCASNCQANVVFATSLKVIKPGPTTKTNLPHNLEVKAYPNPFNNRAMIEFKAPQSQSNVVIQLCSLTGDKLATLFDQDTEKGNTYQAEVNSDNLASGTYVYRIIFGDQVISKKLVLMK